jgi:hypothetical protein
MKIVTTHLKSRYSGIINAAQSVMGEITLWDSNSVPLFDFFYFTKPDLLFVDEEFVTDNFMEAIAGIDTKIILFGNKVKEGFNPDVVCAEPSASVIMKKHLENNYNVIYINDFVDVINDIGGEFDERLSSDIGMIFENINFGMKDLQFILNISSLHQFKIIGRNNLTLPACLGTLSYKRKLDFIKSVKIMIDFNGLNFLKYAANGVFTLPTVPNSLFPTIDIENSEKILDEFLNNKEKRTEIANKAKFKVLDSSTNFHRLIDILSALDLKNKESYIDESKERILEVLS